MKILVVCAHLDDETFGLGGTLFKLSRNNDIQMITLCCGRKETDSVPREHHFNNIITKLGIISEVYGYPDLSLDLVNFQDIVSVIQSKVDKFKPDVVYSSCEDDLHRDHQVVAEATKLACRPLNDCSVKELYQFIVPGTSYWNFNHTNYNVAYDITSYFDQKKLWCSGYLTEIKDGISPNSIDGIETFNKHVGNMFGFKYAELCKLVYKRC